MTKKELFEYFNYNPDPDKNGKKKREEIFKKQFQELYQEFLNFHFDDDLKDKPFRQKLWHFL